MTLIQYGTEKNIGAERIAMIDAANAILQEMGEQGYTLTLRQLYYQFVARGLIENTERSYKNLGTLITDGRMAGLISWTAIEDRGRGVEKYNFVEDPAELLDGIEGALIFDFWARQPIYVECWVEKEALSNVLERPCNRYRVPYMACKGYLSASEAWRSGRRFMEAGDAGKELVLIHLGDHDPSGIDMTRDNLDRLETFSGYSVEVRRIALNRDQINRYKPPPNPTKLTDSRATGYLRDHGKTCWELDALSPSVIEALIVKEIRSLIDDDIWAGVADEETEQRKTLAKLAPHWDRVEKTLARVEA